MEEFGVAGCISKGQAQLEKRGEELGGLLWLLLGLGAETMCFEFKFMMGRCPRKGCLLDFSCW
jgi:hypothetical protein